MNTCSVCSHERRGEIDAAVIAGKSARGIVRQIGHAGPSHDAIDRHRQCIVDLIAKADQKASRTVLARITDLVGKIETLAAEAFEDRAKCAPLFLAAARELRPSLELMGQANGQIMNATMQGMLAALGVQNEAQLRSAVDLARSTESVTLDELYAEALDTLRMVLSERPELRGDALSAIGGSMAMLEAHVANRNGSSSHRNGSDGSVVIDDDPAP